MIVLGTIILQSLTNFFNRKKTIANYEDLLNCSPKLASEEPLVYG